MTSPDPSPVVRAENETTAARAAAIEPRWMCHDSACLTESALEEGPHDYHEAECRRPDVQLKTPVSLEVLLDLKWDEVRYEQALAREKRLEVENQRLRDKMRDMEQSERSDV